MKIFKFIFFVIPFLSYASFYIRFVGDKQAQEALDNKKCNLFVYLKGNYKPFTADIYSLPNKNEKWLLNENLKFPIELPNSEYVYLLCSISDKIYVKDGEIYVFEFKKDSFKFSHTEHKNI